jgi:hypothetical protein
LEESLRRIWLKSGTQERLIVQGARQVPEKSELSADVRMDEASSELGPRNGEAVSKPGVEVIDIVGELPGGGSLGTRSVSRGYSAS